MKITFDTAGKGFLARLGDLILNKFDGSESHIAALTQAVSLVAGRLGALGAQGDIEGFYAACISHRDAGFEWSQAEADKLAEAYGVKAPPVEFRTKEGRGAWAAKSWQRLFDVLHERDALGDGSIADLAVAYIEKIAPKKAVY